VEEPDPAVVRAAAAGDLGAFEQLVRAYQVPVWRFLRHLLADAALAEDVTQETFLRAHQRLGTFAFRSRFSTWLFAIARHAGIDALRVRARRDRLAAAAVPPAPVGDASLRTEVAASVASLPDRLREAFLLVEVLGLTYREVAESAGVPVGTVKSRVFRARRLLVTWLRAEDGEVHSHEL
jgi:RNA polymerase sigma-70 factor (ECF subfamily)